MRAGCLTLSSPAQQPLLCLSEERKGTRSTEAGDGDSEKEGNMNMQIGCLGQGKHFLVVETAVFPGFFLQCDYREFNCMFQLLFCSTVWERETITINNSGALRHRRRQEYISLPQARSSPVLRTAWCHLTPWSLGSYFSI